jgi:hypothetical protein
LTTAGPALVKAVRESPVIHILSSMVLVKSATIADYLETEERLTLDAKGNITVDQFSFRFDDWSQIAPSTVCLMRLAISQLANGLWWEPIVDVLTNVKISVNDKTGDI